MSLHLLNVITILGLCVVQLCLFLSSPSFPKPRAVPGMHWLGGNEEDCGERAETRKQCQKLECPFPPPLIHLYRSTGDRLEMGKTKQKATTAPSPQIVREALVWSHSIGFASQCRHDAQ